MLCRTVLDREILCSRQLEIETLANLSSLTVSALLMKIRSSIISFSFGTEQMRALVVM